VELTVLFVDVRGSTSIAEGMGPNEYSLLMNRFYRAVTEVLVKTDAYIDKFVGDEVMAVYLPLFAGQDPARQAVTAARQLLTATGQGDAGGTWLPIGIGVHTGPAYFGTVAGADGLLSDFTALGDSVNVAARVVGAARVGEALISSGTAAASALDTEGLEVRALQMKGKTHLLDVYVLTDGSSTASPLDWKAC
jgi:adenylate cyclase